MNTATSSRNLSPALVGLAVGLIGVTGILHLVQAPEDLNEVAFRGALFIANGVLGLVAAYGIWRGSKTWAWLLGLLVAGGALGFYVISRSIGIPGWEDSIGEWFEPIGVLSWLVEAGFVALALMAFTRTHETQDPKEFATAQR